MERNSIAVKIGLEFWTEILHSNEDFGPIKKGETVTETQFAGL
jgi:hypothetical protein